jgi:hypothetical protein
VLLSKAQTGQNFEQQSQSVQNKWQGETIMQQDACCLLHGDYILSFAFSNNDGS